MRINEYILALSIIFSAGDLYAGLLINEIASATSGDDWVELFFYSETKESLEVSGLHVTMYYGTSERLSDDTLTIYSYDRPETAWDDRFIVVHLTAPGGIDETDLTGDTNRNGYIDVYCNNYSGSLWSTDCAVAIDEDSDPSNGGIIDFAAYSNRDGTPNTDIESYVKAAQGFYQWAACPGSNIQDCMIYTGNKDLEPYMTISRKGPADTNSQDDFAVTKYMTPGRENLLSDSIGGGRDLFKAKKKKISITPENFANGNAEIEIFVFENCNIRLRIFSSIGMLIYESPLYKNIYPGNFAIPWDIKGRGKKAATGLYLGLIEATKKELKKSQEERIYLILSQYRK